MTYNIKIIILVFTFFSILFCSNQSINAQITRGTSPGEILISSTWYYLGGQNNYDAIFYSSDHGNSLTIQYIFNIGSQNMPVGKLKSDAFSGTFYNNVDELWISNNYGITWTFVENIGTDKRYSSGGTQGEIYKYCKNPDSKIYRSTDFGQSFQEINNGIFGFPEIGTQEGEIYLLTGSTWPTFNIDLLYSSDYGSKFDTITIDSTIQGHYLAGNFPEISRGTTPGEMYLITWHLPANYYIYHSYDYGQEFDLKYISDECNFYYENYYFTAGKASGEFYIVKQIPWYDGIFTKLDIYYSQDTAQNFYINHHILDETTPVTKVESFILKPNRFECFPNPFTGKTTFSIPETENSDKRVIHIYNLNGTLVRQIPCNGKTSLVWNATDSHGNRVKAGIYLYNITNGSHASEFIKLVVTS